MPWDYKTDVPDSMKYLKPSIQKKAISIANAILRNGGDEGTAIAVGIKNAKKHHDKKGLVKIAFTLPGAILGSVIGSSLGKKVGSNKEKRKRNSKIGGWAGSVAGAFGGAYAKRKFIESLTKNSYKHNKKFFDDFQRSYKPPTQNTDIKAFFKEHNVDHSKIKTKLEAKKFYRDAARKHHPDMGGDSEKFKKLSTDWESVENSSWFNKLAAFQHSKFYKSLLKELKKGNDKFLSEKYENVIIGEKK